ncbi:MAG: homoaconitate hydratase [bacterium]|nr:homoaconitate hydratase [Acidimicrobiia bacterium]MCY4650697.1 homoaconitate hydratase [bacterium]
MLDRHLVWTGSFNEVASDKALERGVGIYDTTLRDGEQTVGVALGPEAKLEIALALDRLGVDRIEAGFPRVSQDDVEAFRLILAAGLGAEIWGFSRAVKADVEQLVDLGVKAAVIETPVSDGKLSAYGLTREVVSRRVIDSVRFAVDNGIHVCFFGVDGSRADFGFLDEIYTKSIAAGAAEIALVDTLGIAAPEAAADMVTQARSWVGDDIPIHWHGHDDFGLATAGALEAVRAGADWVQGTINGMGERAGNMDIAEFAIAFEAVYGGRTAMRLENIVEVADTVQKLSGYHLAPWKPVTGRNLFIRESGAVASQFHDPTAIEPYSSTLVGAERGLVLGKKSGLASIKIKADELGLDIPKEYHAILLERVKQRAIRAGGLVSNEGFVEMVKALTSKQGV